MALCVITTNKNGCCLSCMRDLIQTICVISHSNIAHSTNPNIVICLAYSKTCMCSEGLKTNKNMADGPSGRHHMLGNSNRKGKHSLSCIGNGAYKFEASQQRWTHFCAQSFVNAFFIYMCVCCRNLSNWYVSCTVHMQHKSGHISVWKVLIFFYLLNQNRT